MLIAHPPGKTSAYVLYVCMYCTQSTTSEPVCCRCSSSKLKESRLPKIRAFSTAPSTQGVSCLRLMLATLTAWALPHGALSRMDTPWAVWTHHAIILYTFTDHGVGFQILRFPLLPPASKCNPYGWFCFQSTVNPDVFLLVDISNMVFFLVFAFTCGSGGKQGEPALMTLTARTGPNAMIGWLF